MPLRIQNVVRLATLQIRHNLDHAEICPSLLTERQCYVTPNASMSK